MRLWHEALIPYLPKQQLLSQHRECCMLRGSGWGKNYATVNYVFEYPYGWLFAYHHGVMNEMNRRGYKVSEEWANPLYRGKSIGLVAGEQAINIYYEIATLSICHKGMKYIYPEHNEVYLQECLNNLASKKIYINMKFD